MRVLRSFSTLTLLPGILAALFCMPVQAQQSLVIDSHSNRICDYDKDSKSFSDCETLDEDAVITLNSAESVISITRNETTTNYYISGHKFVEADSLDEYEAEDKVGTKYSILFEYDANTINVTPLDGGNNYFYSIDDAQYVDEQK